MALKKLENDDPGDICGLASKNGGVKEPPLSPASDGALNRLRPRAPNPEEEFRPLSGPLPERLTNAVIDELRRICEARNSPLDYGYWKEITRAILLDGAPNRALSIPARAGSGKSTWITAFILAVSRLWLNKDPLAEALGGILLVFQKVETLNALYETLSTTFPGKRSPMVPLQSWSKSGQEQGYCKNTEVRDNRECDPSRCPYSEACKVLAFHKEKDSAFILGITQARFTIMRRNGELDRCLTRRLDSKTVHRRFLICDEKPPMVEEHTLNMETIAKASSELEALIEKGGANDLTVASIQRSLGYCIERPFQQLRTETGHTGSQKSLPFGLCSLGELPQEDLDRYAQFKEKLDWSSSFHTPAVNACVAVMDQLIEGECLYGRSGSFGVFATTAPIMNFGQSVTLIFDATAEVDGDYKCLPDSKMLSSSPTGGFGNVQFHIWTDPIFNVSENAMKKAWKIPALAAFAEELLEQYPGETFLCTYRRYAELLAQLLPRKEILKLPQREPPCVPYFGGTNGDNRFNRCTNVILMGYPRLSPQTYLRQTWAFWRNAGFEQEIRNALSPFQHRERPSAYLQDLLPSVRQYELYHLAARLEQELYRCAIRNPGNQKEIQIFMFAPPSELAKMLVARFPGCHVDPREEVPSCVEQCQAKSRLYKGEKTSFSRLADYIANWEGPSIRVSALRDELAISNSVWKDLIGSEKVKKLFEGHGITRTGRGINAELKKAS